MKLIYLYLVLIISTFVSPLSAKRLTTSMGLSHNGVTSVIEDSRGYLWVGTYDGLNLYNGRNFTYYRNNMDSNVLRNNRIRSLKEDSRGLIWIGTENGIMLFDFIQNKFLPINIPSGLFQNDAVIKSIIESNAGEIIAVTDEGGLARFNLDGKLLKYDHIIGTQFNSVIEYSPNYFNLA